MNSFRDILTIRWKNLEFLKTFNLFFIKKCKETFHTDARWDYISIDILKSLKKHISVVWKTPNYGHFESHTVLYDSCYQLCGRTYLNPRHADNTLSLTTFLQLLNICSRYQSMLLFIRLTPICGNT